MTARTLNAHGVALGREAFERQNRKDVQRQPMPYYQGEPRCQAVGSNPEGQVPTTAPA